MADVAQKAVSANNVYNGRIVLKSSGAPTRFQTITPTINGTISASDLEAKLTDRMDDPRYYSGDSPA